MEFSFLPRAERSGGNEEIFLGGVWRVCPPREGACGPGAAAGRGGGPTGGGLGCLPRRGYRPRKADGARSVSSAGGALFVRIKRLASLRRYCNRNTPVKCAPPRCPPPPPVVCARARARARVRRVLVPDARVREAGRRARSFTSHRRAPRARACAHAFTSLSYHCAVCACPLVPG